MKIIRSRDIRVPYFAGPPVTWNIFSWVYFWMFGMKKTDRKTLYSAVEYAIKYKRNVDNIYTVPFGGWGKRVKPQYPGRSEGRYDIVRVELPNEHISIAICWSGYDSIPSNIVIKYWWNGMDDRKQLAKMSAAIFETVRDETSLICRAIAPSRYHVIKCTLLEDLCHGGRPEMELVASDFAS